MTLDFLNTPCAEIPRTDTEFGLCDDQKKAYSDNENPQNWVATVKNNRSLELTFTPVDKCLLQDYEQNGIVRCDGILTSSDHLFFIELNTANSDWIQPSINQLESTIELFTSNHDINQFKHKKAFACNKKHKHFQEIDNERNISFFRKHKVRLDIQAEVIVV